MMKSLSKSLAVVIMLLAGLTVVSGKDVKTVVKYINASAIYLDAGRIHGVSVGDRADVRRGDSLIAVLEIAFVADRSSSCRLMESTGVIKTGDTVLIQVADLASADSAISPAKPADAAGTAEPAVKALVKRGRQANRFSGHLGFETLWQDDQTESDGDFAQPAAVLRLRFENVMASRHTLSVRLRGRQTLHHRDSEDDSRRDWTGRIFEVSLTYDNPQSAVHYGMGRILSNRIRGIGSLDGIVFDYRLREHFSVGVFGGTEPDAQTTEIRGSRTKYGCFGSYERGESSSQHFRSTLALAGRYVEGSINREFLYEQLDYTVGAKLWMLQSAELNINRDWKSDAGESSLELAAVLWSLRYNWSRALNTSLSYDNRTDYRTWETRDTPDSLFEDNRRQGMQFGIRWHALRDLRFSAGCGLRTMNSLNRDSRSYSADVALQNALINGLTVSLSIVGFNNSFTSGVQPSLSISKYMLPSLLAGLYVGRNSYRYRSSDAEIENNWLKLRCDAYFTSSFYGSAYFERYEGDNPTLNRLLLETGFRW